MSRLIARRLIMPAIILWGSTLYAVDNPHGKLVLDCETCHTTESWSKVQFSHDDVDFDLALSHDDVSCRRCHVLNDFAQADRECRKCHADIHAGGMGPDCQRCHTPLRWEIFDTEEIHSRTRFPMLGRHNLIDCRSCHVSLLKGDYTKTSVECVDCHEKDYLSTQSPGHVSLGISTMCTECHEPIEWRPAFFPSHDVIFPIFSGEHRDTWGQCRDCHPDPSNFSVFSCLGCHSRSEMDDEHGSLPGYAYDSATCLGCHPTGSKEEGVLEKHDTVYFPIFQGPHSSSWDACSDCHSTPGDYSLFSCIDCHEHDQDAMDSRHAGLPSYGYDSVSCYGCHPTGEGGDFLEHDQLYFPVYSGSHLSTWEACVDCHNVPGDFSIYTCIDCHEHDQSTMDNRHSGIPGYSFDSFQCFGCHPDGEIGDFEEHDQLYFPIYSGKHREAWGVCADCHIDPGSWSVFSCIDCHEHRQSEMDDKHSDEQDYVYDSQACYDCHPNGEEMGAWKRKQYIK